MAEDLQYLMERIQKDAVDKAETEAAAIIARAKDKAAEIVKAAEAEASARLEKADKDAEAFTERSERTLEQPTVLRMLSDLTGVDVTTIPLDDQAVMSLFTSLLSKTAHHHFTL